MAAFFTETGYRKEIKLSNREEIVHVMATYHTLVKVKAQIDQFTDGLRSVSVYEHITKYPDLMQPLFVYQTNKLTAGKYEI